MKATTSQANDADFTSSTRVLQPIWAIWEMMALTAMKANATAMKKPTTP